MKGTKTLFSSASDEWTTPGEFLAAVEDEWGTITLDAAATPANAVVGTFLGPEEDALAVAWGEENLIWLNPPYSKIKAFVRKAIEEVDNGNNRVLILVPARTDTKWFQEVAAEGMTFFLKGRLKFGNGKKASSAPFPSALIYLGGPVKGGMALWEWRR